MLSGEDALQVLSEIGFARSFLAAVEALAVERVRQACESEAAKAVAGSERQAVRFGGDVGRALAVSEVAVAEGITEFAAGRLINAAEALCGPQLAVLTRLEGGVLSEAHARVITDETATLPESVAEEFGIECLRRLETRGGRRRTSGEFRKAVRSLRERLHPESIQARRVRAQRDRGVWVKPEPDGMCTLTAFVPAEVGLASLGRIDSLARARRESDPEEGRTLPQLRADILAHLLVGEVGRSACSRGQGGEGEGGGGACGRSECSVGGEGQGGGGACGRGECRVGGEGQDSGGACGRGECDDMEQLPRPRAEIVVHISAESLLGAGDEPGELEGYGAIDAATARELAVAAPNWQRLFVGEDGVPLSLGRSSYRPSKGLRRFIEYRDGKCQFPGCARPARRSEVDHIVEWQDGGTTDATNLQALCSRHHALKSLRLWSPARLERAATFSINGGAGDLAAAVPAIGDRSTGDVLWTSRLGARGLAGPIDRELGRCAMEPVASLVEPEPPPF